MNKISMLSIALSLLAGFAYADDAKTENTEAPVVQDAAKEADAVVEKTEEAAAPVATEESAKTETTTEAAPATTE
ncbi:MAG: hypothetical protein Q4E61_00235, partial [Alphaproteobacteria bacterium]|nr:hypothetical protein [Alphaproteobacteria bacterium]